MKYNIPEMLKFLGTSITKIDIYDFDGYKIEVIDKKTWVSNISQLIPVFGKLIFEEYEGKNMFPKMILKIKMLYTS